MEVILHIGMGKTGTSSIQKALSDNADSLRAQDVDYLGMWFDIIDPKFSGGAGSHEFYGSSAEDQIAYAKRFVERLEQRQAKFKCSRFLLSNEAIYGLSNETIFGKNPKMTPFINALQQLVNVELIIYVRDPREWLPSAYAQWAVYHKVEPGQIKPFAEKGRSLVKVYSGLPRWVDLFGDILTVRLFQKSVNVVEDFAKILGVDIVPPKNRSLERVETSENLLRAIYNTRLPTGVLPDRFNRAFRQLDFARSPSIATLVRDSFTYGQTDAIVAEQAALFDEIKDKLGLDLLSGPAPAQKTVDPEEMRHRALEHVLQIVMQQADRITHLEQTVRQFEAAMKDE
jgi:hypothetical protein